MALFRIPPTRADVQVANAVSDGATPRTERVAKLMTWAADEHVVLALAAACWLFCRNKRAERRAHSDHLLLTTVVASLLPHVLKSIVDQRRPDRLTVTGHLHGVPFSGKVDYAFPSGHAMRQGRSVPPQRPCRRENAT